MHVSQRRSAISQLSHGTYRQVTAPHYLGSEFQPQIPTANSPHQPASLSLFCCAAISRLHLSIHHKPKMCIPLLCPSFGKTRSRPISSIEACVILELCRLPW